MSDLSNTLRNMKFMQRTSDSRKKIAKKSSSISQTVASIPIVSTPDHPCCWRIIENRLSSSTETINSNTQHPSIIYRPSVFSIHDRIYTRLSFQNFNKRLEPLMMKYGLKQELKHLEDGEIDPNDDQDEDDEEKKSLQEETDPKPVSSLVKTIGKKFGKKSLSRVHFDNKSRINKRRRRRGTQQQARSQRKTNHDSN